MRLQKNLKNGLQYGPLLFDSKGQVFAEAILPLTSSPRFIEWSKPLGGLFFLFFALMLGYWANRAAQVEADETWQKTHHPKFEVIRWVFSSMELRRVESDRQFAKIQRELPATLEEEGAFWVTENGDWVYSLAHADEGIPFFAFCRECSPTPQKWLPMGKGWVGLERTMDWLEKTRKVKPKKVAKKGRRGDPREIVF
jgi:hypothetical protein